MEKLTRLHGNKSTVPRMDERMYICRCNKLAVNALTLSLCEIRVGNIEFLFNFTVVSADLKYNFKILVKPFLLFKVDQLNNYN